MTVGDKGERNRMKERISERRKEERISGRKEREERIPRSNERHRKCFIPDFLLLFTVSSGDPFSSVVRWLCQ